MGLSDWFCSSCLICEDPCLSVAKSLRFHLKTVPQICTDKIDENRTVVYFGLRNNSNRTGKMASDIFCCPSGFGWHKSVVQLEMSIPLAPASVQI